MVDPEIRMPKTGHRLRSVARQSLAVLMATTALGVVSAHAVDGTWTGFGVTPGEWVEGDNWTSNPTVPNGTATFTNTGFTNVANNNGIVSIGEILFTPTAQSYSFTINDPFIVNATGIVNNSTNTQTFEVTSGNSLVFQNGSAASGGTGAVSITNDNGGFITFENTSTAGTATIVNNSILQFSNTSTAGTAHVTNNIEMDFFDNASAGGSNITNASTGTLTFNNSATAGTSTIGNSGTLQFNNSSTAGGSTINGASGSTITFSNTSTAGTANINLTGSAALTFNDTSSAGTAVISPAALGGTITFNNSSTASGSTIHLADTTLTFNNSSNAGTSTITMSDLQHPGSITFNGTSSAANATITNVSSAGLGTGVQFLGASTAGNATITNNPNSFNPGGGGTLAFGTVGGTDTSNAGTAHIINNSTASTSFFAHTSAMNATITNNSGGTTNFQDQSTASGATIVNNGGTTNFGVPIVGTDTATAGTASITNNAGGTTVFTAATTAGNAVIMNNTGGFLQFGDSGAGSSTASAGNAVITNSGTTSFNALTTAGNSTITTNSGGNVFFFDSSTGGTAQFITNAGGTFDMSGLTAAGMTAGSIAGAGSYVLGDKNLSVGSNNLSTTVSGVISGVGGSLTKTGTGTLTLSNTDTYTGATTVNDGALIVNGSTALSSLTTVNTGATLGGGGTVGNTAIVGGTLAPGSTTSGVFGPLTVQGNLSFTAASTYLIQVSPANAGRTNVTGTAMLGGATVDAVFMPGSYVSRQYTIVNSTGVLSGMFNPTVVSNMTSLQSSLSYDNHDAYLNIKLNFTPPSGNLNVNQQNVANALVNFFNSTGGIPAAFTSLGPANLTQISGEIATASQQTTFDAMNLFLGIMTDPFIAGRGNPVSSGGSASGYADEASAYTSDGKPRSKSERDAYAAIYNKAPPAADPFAQRWSVWAAGYGGSQTTDGNAALGSNTVTSSVYGTAVGADYRFSPFTMAGFALAGGGTNFSLANALGSGRSDLFQAGAYIRHNAGPAYITAALAYGWQDITTNRTVTVAGVDQLQARFNANAFSGRLEGGYRYTTPWMGITPYAAAQFTTFDLPAYAESVLSGANTFALAYNAKSVTDSRSELGLRSDKSFPMQDGIFTLRGRLAWAHDFDPDRNIAATFQTLPGASFVVNGAAQAHDSALTTASAEMKWMNGWSVAATFEGEFSSVTSSYAGKGVVRYTW
jgi:uncharacterized protein with beta-barrel porin domain